jgi:hypothetical protein
MNSIIEMFLSEYFFVGAILGKYLDDSKKLFFGLGKMFYIPNDQLDNLYAKTEEPKVKNIVTEKDFALYLRIKKYSQLFDVTFKENIDIDEMVTIKGNALTKAVNLKLASANNISHNNLYATLTTFADSGIVDAIRVLGILQCEGIFVDKNLPIGIGNLTKAANWNDIKSVVALLNYDAESKEYNLNRLHMLIKDTPFFGLYEQAVKGLNGFKPKEIKETKLLRKAFNATVLKREICEPKYARVLCSKAISLHDKEKAFFSPSKELITAIADLPLKVAQIEPTRDLSWLANVALCRKGEQAKIAANLGYNIRSSAYRTLDLCSNSVYLLKMYARAIQNLTDVNVECINVSDLASYDLEPTANNIFIRSVDEDKPNIFLIYMLGDIPEQITENIKGFLQTEKRSKFHLSVPNVTIDLGNVLPIVLCDKSNSKNLADICDTVVLADISQKELPDLIDDIVESKKCEYGIADIKWSNDVINCLCNMSADNIEKCIDKAIRAEALQSGEVQLDKDILTKYKDTDKMCGCIGFGGTEL